MEKSISHLLISDIFSKRTIVFSESEEALMRFDVDVERKEYKNIRYKMEHIWYYGEVKIEMLDKQVEVRFDI